MIGSTGSKTTVFLEPFSNLNIVKFQWQPAVEKTAAE